MTRKSIRLFRLMLLITMIQGGSIALPSSINTIPKPADSVPELRARTQPTVPENYREIPFIEKAPAPELTDEEQARGYLLFQRPITEPVYPNTRPLGHERVEQLTAFATPGEFEPLTFSLYPTRDLENLGVRCSSLSGDAGEIPASEITVRLVTYWNIGYPRYTSRDTYRRTPELLERVTVHTAPAHESQRYWILVHVPEDAGPGLYQGSVTVWDDRFDQAVQIPVAFHVLSFPLQRDPAKHDSVYYYVRNRTQYQGKPESFVQKASENEYRAMLEYGLDMVPTQYLQCLDGETFTLKNGEDLDRLLEMGFTGPVPLAAGSAIERIYRDMTPGGRRRSHWQIEKMPPPEFYDRVTELFKAFEVERKTRGWPEFVCCPLDEVAATHKEFGAKVYGAVRAAGIRTYITKNPLASDAVDYQPYVDVWCSQPYSTPYEKIVTQDRYEYWSYPNHNAGEIKDRRVMCKGGRMTYGFGFWRSGYTTLIPWHWSWTPGDDQFDYLRGSHSGCGQRLTDDGEVIPAIYWECFREGNDDARYLYTLQQASFEREGTGDPACRRAVEEGKELLQETWDAIHVQQKYLADGMWPSEEFNARRWLLAQTIERLHRYPPERQGIAPSVLVADTTPRPAEDKVPLIERAFQAGNVEVKDLSGDFTSWVNGTKEGTVEVTEAAGRQGQRGLRWRVHVDHENDGGEGGNYPVGWPRIARTFDPGELDLSAYDYLSFLVRVDSDRDEVADDSTPLGFLIASHKIQGRFFETQRDLGDQQRVWIPVRFSIKKLTEEVGRGIDPWRDISRMQVFIAERNFAHGTHLTFDITEAQLLRFKSPMISQIDAPTYIMLPRAWLPVEFEAMGTGTVEAGSHTVTATLETADGRSVVQQQQDLAERRIIVLNTASLSPGRYRIRLKITDAEGNFCSEETHAITTLAGPAYE